MSKEGLIIVNKPAGFTSHDVVAKVRRILKVKKIGHTGTLDPDATGVLVLMVGKATKIAQFLQIDTKEYRAEMVLGIKTDTQDASGKVIFKAACDVSEEEVKQALEHFKGKIVQVPPMVSAVKINGERLYKLAREGKEVHRSPRTVDIFYIDFLGMAKGVNPVVDFAVGCSKGTYVRTLCSDIGDFLGCGAHLGKLVRTRCGDYGLNKALSIEQIEKLAASSAIDDHFILMKDALNRFSSIIVKKPYVGDILNGRFLVSKMIEEMSSKLEEGNFVKLLDEGQNLLAVFKTVDCFEDDLVAKPIRVFAG